MNATNAAAKTKDHRICALALSAMVLLVLLTACSGRDKTNEMPPRNRAAKDFNLSVTLNDSTYSQTDPVTITVALLALDDGRASVVYQNIFNPVRNYDLTLVDQHGQNVPLTETGMRLKLTRHGSMGWLLEKDTPWHDSFRLDDLFDLSEPGVYTLTLNKKVWTSTTISRELTTDPVTFTLLP